MSVYFDLLLVRKYLDVSNSSTESNLHVLSKIKGTYL